VGNPFGQAFGAWKDHSGTTPGRDASFPENKSLEGFDWNFNPKTFNRVQTEELATSDFIRRRTNLVMVGWSWDREKSHYAGARAKSLCQWL
jgi:hypothetical protein